ncbi:hypothetical protein HD593_008215 [Nonomuraea rubra]|uniref:Uncharacterized protein n=1 Tax=Nonomuraea rubra TaxID=46180 RepID=A0A7X0P1B0_9ACTN|nr:hypothetical protein [Nonomuraea rubra]
MYVSISSDGAGKQPVPALLRKALTQAHADGSP